MYVCVLSLTGNLRYGSCRQRGVYIDWLPCIRSCMQIFMCMCTLTGDLALWECLCVCLYVRVCVCVYARALSDQRHCIGSCRQLCMFVCSLTSDLSFGLVSRGVCACVL